MLALICGAGDLPRAIHETLEPRPLVCAMRGFEPAALTPDVTFRLETLGTLIADLQARGITHVCLCGAIRRPDIDPSALDALTAPLVPRLAQAMALGDDGALRIVLSLFEENGMVPLAAHQAAPALLPPQGMASTARPGPDVTAQARLGDLALTEMAAADLGQACVIRDGVVIARETDSGTDAMLRAIAGDPGQGGFLFKAPKPGQDRRADLPVIGPDTVARAKAAGLLGIVIEAQGVMVLHGESVRAALDAAGLFLWVRPSSDGAAP